VGAFGLSVLEERGSMSNDNNSGLTWTTFGMLQIGWLFATTDGRVYVKTHSNSGQMLLPLKHPMVQTSGAFSDTTEVRGIDLSRIIAIESNRDNAPPESQVHADTPTASDTREWTTFGKIPEGQLFRSMGGQYGIKVEDSKVVFALSNDEQKTVTSYWWPGRVYGWDARFRVKEVVDLEKQQDTSASPPESQVRSVVAPSLPNVVPFFDEQLDVHALLAEAAKAHEQDRPCTGGEPQMIDRLAHIIRTYRGMETRDEPCKSTHETGLTCSQKLWAHNDGFHYANSPDGRLHRWADEKGVHAKSLGTSLFVQLQGNNEPFWALVKPHNPTWQPIGGERDGALVVTDEGHLYVLVPHESVAGHIPSGERVGIMIAPSAATTMGHACCIRNDRLVHAIAAGSAEHQQIIDKDREQEAKGYEVHGVDALKDIRAILRAAGFETGSQPAKLALNRLVLLYKKEHKELEDIRAIVRPSDGELASLCVKKMHDAHETMANELGEVHLLLTKAGMHPPKCQPTDNTARRLALLFNDIEGALYNAETSDASGDTFAVRIRALSREIDKRDAAITAFWQDIRSAVGPVDVTDADREAVTEEDAANGPDAREYYAERRALIRTVREHDGKYHGMRLLLERNGFNIGAEYAVAISKLDDVLRSHAHEQAVRNQFDRELSEIRDVLSKESYHVDTHAELMDVIRSLVDAEPAAQEDDGEPVPSAAIWQQRHERTYNSHILDLLATHLLAPEADDVLTAPMIRSRIVDTTHALSTFAAAHGIDLFDYVD
jgi:hypothetical protein